VKTILSFDCATSAGAVAAVTGGGAGWTAKASELTSLIDDLVEDPHTIDGIVVGTGPGSFTSIRIALATARGLALALDVPVAGSSTLGAYAHGTPVIDARRGEVFSREGVGVPEELDVAGKTLVGDGAVRYRALFEAAGATIPPDDDPVHRPDPVALAEHAGPFGPVEAVDPLYLRDPDAKPSL
jgi:tRNA threonylcarbamoyl adenosine modification protein YeaZ